MQKVILTASAIIAAVALLIFSIAYAGHVYFARSQWLDKNTSTFAR